MALTEEENQRLLELFEISKKTPRITRELFKEEFGYYINEGTIKKKWKKAGLKLQDRGGLRHGLTLNQYEKLYEECNGNLEEMIEITGFKKQSIVSKCHVLGLEPVDI